MAAVTSAPDLQDAGGGEAALVDQGAARFGPQVEEVLQEQGRQRPSQRGSRLRQQGVEIPVARDRTVRRVQAEGAAQLPFSLRRP